MTEKQFNTEYLPLAGTLYRIAFYILEDKALAEDAVQEVFLKLWETRDRLNGILTPKAYCITMVKNICLDRVRRASRLEFPSQLPEQEAPPVQDAIDNKERLAMVMEAVKSLPDRQREVLLLRTVEGLSYEEISARTGIGALSLRVLLSRARTTLKEKL